MKRKMFKHVITWEWRESSRTAAAKSRGTLTTTTTSSPPVSTTITTTATSTTTLATVQQQPQENQTCATYLFPSLPQPSVQTSLSGDLSGGVMSKSVSVLRGHARSASHGGVGASLTSSGSVGVVSRPSALKQSRGHQRAFSQGQIVEGGAGSSLRGHSRVGSRTDFILPPGHKDTDSSTVGSGSASKPSGRGHSRQASRSESIYTLRQSGPPSLWSQFQSYIFRRGGKADAEEPRYRTVVPNHLVPPHTPKKAHPNGRRPDNRIRTTKYTFLSFLPKNLLEQFHRVANLYFICIVLLNWVPAINAFGKEIAMIPVLFVLGVTAIKDLFEDRRRHGSDKRINNSTCRVYKSDEERYKKVLWKNVCVGDLIHLSNNEVIPADVLLLRSSDPHGLCYLDTCNLDGETNLKQREVARGFEERQDVFEPCKFKSVVEVDNPTTKIYRFHGAIVHPSGERIPVGTENLLLRECVLKNTDFVEGIVVYAGHETKAMLNNGGPRYKRSNLERQMNLDVIWCVLILFVLCVIGAVGCKLWLSSYETYDNHSVPFIPLASSPVHEGFLGFWTFIIILQVMIPLSLYVTIEMAKIIQVYHIHNDMDMYDPQTNKRIECRALNITEELGQVQYIFSDKTGTLTENKMIFRRCTIAGIDYNHPSAENTQNLKLRPGVPMPLLVNPQLQEELQRLEVLPTDRGTIHDTRQISHSQRIQEFLLLLAVCNTVVVSHHPHHDMVSNPCTENEAKLTFSNPELLLLLNIEMSDTLMNASGVIESAPSVIGGHSEGVGINMVSSQPHDDKIQTTPSTKQSIAMPVGNVQSDKYSRLSESRSVTPSPPPPHGQSYPPHIVVNIPSSEVTPFSRPVLNPIASGKPPVEVLHQPILSPINSSSETTPTTESPLNQGRKHISRPKLLNVPSLLLVGSSKKSGGKSGSSHNKSQQQANAATPSPCEIKPIFEAESPDELALVNAAYSYNCRLVKRTPHVATVAVPGEGTLEFEILQVLPFDSARKCMSIVLRHPTTREMILYCKGADSTILPQLAPTDDFLMQQLIFRTQQHLNSYARQGLRVLVMARRTLSEAEYSEWLQNHEEAKLALENRERRLRESFSRLETNLTLLGATGIEDRLQEGVPETINALINAGIVIWVLTGDKPETAINVAYSAKLFSPQMELLKLSARSKDAAESTILFYLSEIERETPPEIGMTGVAPGLNQVGVFARATITSPSALQHRGGAMRSLKKRALVIDGKTLTYILDQRSNLQKPFLQLTRYCCSVLCCRATPLQKAYIVRVVKSQLKMRTLAIGDGANDVSMIQTADVGVGISGQEGMQAVMASDFALSRFKYLERFLLVHGHWCYDRLSRMVLYFFYKNATFVFLIFWYQLYCGFSGSVMIDQMYLMLYNLLFTSLPPLAIGVYDQDAAEDLLLTRPFLYRQGRLGLVYKPHSFWITMADSLYQSIVIFFLTEGAYHDTEVGIWEFGTTVTTSCLFVMLCHVSIETRSWTIIHVFSLFVSIGTFFAFSFVYNSICVQCLSLPSNYWVVHHAVISPTYWLVVFLSVVLALIPRFVWRSIETCLFPREVVRAVLEKRRATRRGEDFLVSWSRSTSTSSIFRTTDYGAKDVNQSNLTVVG